jgi:hypothetical protein
MKTKRFKINTKMSKTSTSAAASNTPTELDLAFIIDATGSMGFVYMK